ncbi:hypothetical protein BDV06DRAFT_223028 [Aspergillus oleicola]
MSSTLILTFGLEVEVLLRPLPAMNPYLQSYEYNFDVQSNHPSHSARNTNRQIFHKALIHAMASDRIEVDVKSSKYEKWAITDESALDELPGYYDHGVKGPKFLSINPNGRVPTLEDPNTFITSWESMACINYLLRVYDKDNNKLNALRADFEQAKT